MQIIAFLDNDEKKQGSFIDGIIVDAPYNIHKYKFDYVITIGKYYMEMRLQLLSLGVDETTILDKGIYSMIKKCIHYNVIKDHSNSKKKKLQW